MVSVDQSLDADNPYGFGSMPGKVAVITGGSQGLGLATAELMKARGAAACAAATRRGTIWNTEGAMWDEMLATNVKANGLSSRPNGCSGVDFDQTISGQGPLAPNESVSLHYP